MAHKYSHLLRQVAGVIGSITGKKHVSCISRSKELASFMDQNKAYSCSAGQAKPFLTGEHRWFSLCPLFVMEALIPQPKSGSA